MKKKIFTALLSSTLLFGVVIIKNNASVQIGYCVVKACDTQNTAIGAVTMAGATYAGIQGGAAIGAKIGCVGGPMGALLGAMCGAL